MDEHLLSVTQFYVTKLSFEIRVVKRQWCVRNMSNHNQTIWLYGTVALIKVTDYYLLWAKSYFSGTVIHMYHGVGVRYPGTALPPGASQPAPWGESSQGGKINWDTSSLQQAMGISPYLNRTTLSAKTCSKKTAKGNRRGGGGVYCFHVVRPSVHPSISLSFCS